MAKVAIFGAAGAAGRSIAAELERRDVEYRAVGRARDKLEAAFGASPAAEILPADLEDPDSALRAASIVETIYYCVGAPFTDFGRHPALMRSTITAAQQARVRHLVVLSSVFSYGAPERARVAEDHPREPSSFKGLMRKRQEDMVLALYPQGSLQGLVIRLPDFYGPHADLSLANPLFRAALQGKAANWVGPLDRPREFLFAPDIGPVAVELAQREECFGAAWNFGGQGAITGADFLEKIYQAAGTRLRVRTAGKTKLRIMGTFSSTIRELMELYYLAETPVILDDSRLREKVGNPAKTTYEEGIPRTLDWMRRRGDLASAQGSGTLF